MHKRVHKQVQVSVIAIISKAVVIRRKPTQGKKGEENIISLTLCTGKVFMSMTVLPWNRDFTKKI